MAMSENYARCLNGEVYYSFTAEMIERRRRCAKAIATFNTAGPVTRRRQVEMWNDIVADKSPLPPQAESEEADEELFAEEPWVEPPVRIDYGHVRLGQNVYINSNCTIIDTCMVTVGARTLFGPNVSLYGGGHPLDPDVRNGTKGPEFGREIHIEEDCWIGGCSILLPGVRIGRGSTVGAGSVVTKDVPPYTVVVGNPARVLKQVPRDTKEEETSGALAALQRDQSKQ